MGQLATTLRVAKSMTLMLPSPCGLAKTMPVPRLET
jgi:hypothetical protein